MTMPDSALHLRPELFRDAKLIRRIVAAKIIGCAITTVRYMEFKGTLHTVIGTDGWSVFLFEEEVRKFAHTYKRQVGGRQSLGPKPPRRKLPRDVRILRRFERGQTLRQVCEAEGIPVRLARVYWRTYKYGAEGIDERRANDAVECEARRLREHQRFLERQQAKERAEAARARAKMLERIVSGAASPPVAPPADPTDPRDGRTEPR